MASPFPGQADIVEPVQQAMLAERIDLEGDGFAVRAGDDWFSRSTVSTAFAPRSASSISLSTSSCGRAIGRMPFLKQLLKKMSAKGRRDHAADAEIQQRPGRVFARRAAAEIVARDEDLRIAIGRLVQHEIRDLGPSSS
jgi:hypothetical protein